MKTTERPHQTPSEALNNVSDVLNQVAPYWRTIAGVALVGVTAIGLFGFISSNRKAAEERSWAVYFDAVGNSDAQALQDLGLNSSGSVKPWAQQAAGQAKLIEGMQSLYTDRDQAKSALEEAVAGFSSAATGSDSIGLLNQRSLWGLAQAHEGLNELDKAKSTYQQLLDRWPDSSLATRAQERLASLNSPETQDFYKWFFAQKPVARPAFDAAPSQPFSVPGEPDFSIPDVSIPSSDSSLGDAEAETLGAETLGAETLGAETSGDATSADATSTDDAVITAPTEAEPATDADSPPSESGSEGTEAATEDAATADAATADAATATVDETTEVTEVIEGDDAEPVEVIADP